MENRTKKKNSKNKSSFIVQGGILAIAGIIVRLIGLVKRIPLTNIIGDRGNGYYAAAYEVYAIILLISSYSLPLAVSKLVAARVSKGQFRNANRIFRGALVFATLTGGIACVVVYFFADFLASSVMLEPMSAMALQVLAPTLLIVAVMGVLRGYFQGLGTMMPTAVSQVLEQVVLVIVSLTAANILFGYGEKVGALLQDENYSYAYGAAGGTMGTGAGALFGLLFLLFVFAAYQNIVKKQIRRDTSRNVETYGQIVKILVWTIIPVILSTAVYNISNVLDQRIYNDVMISKGLSEIKSDYWGVFSGKYRVLTNVPIALASAMCASVIPPLTAAVKKGDFKQARDKTAMVIRFTMMIAIPCAVGLAVLAEPIISLLFSGDAELASGMLHVGTISVVFYSLSTLTNGILQGINRMKVPVRNAFIALVIHIGALYVMLEFMDLNIYAVVYANILFSFLMCILNNLSIRKYLKYRQEWVKSFAIPGISAALMGVIIFFLYRGLSMLAGNVIAVTISVLIGAVVYFVLLIVLRGVNERELSSMPGGHLVIRAAKLLHLL